MNTEQLNYLRNHHRVHKGHTVELSVLAFEKLLDEAERAQQLDALLEGNEGMSVMEIRMQFVDLHREFLKLQQENKQLRTQGEVQHG